MPVLTLTLPITAVSVYNLTPDLVAFLAKLKPIFKLNHSFEFGASKMNTHYRISMLTGLSFVSLIL